MPSKACAVTTTLLARARERALASLWQETREEGKSEKERSIHHHFRKTNRFPLGLAHSQFLQRMKKDVRHGGAKLAPGGRGQKNPKFKATLESEASLDYTRQSFKTIILEVVSLNYWHERTKGLVQERGRIARQRS